VTYLIDGLHALFPALDVSARDCIATIAGIRPVLSDGKCDPSEESREHVVWVDKGLVTITGGKLTTFHKLAVDALKAARPFLPPGAAAEEASPVFLPPENQPVSAASLSGSHWETLSGRYGRAAESIINAASHSDLTAVPGTRTLWAELRHAATHAAVHHLSDLLLRRVRVGLLTPEGGRAHLDRVRHLCAPALGWDAARWKKETRSYLETYRFAHGLPGRHAESRGRVKSFFFTMGKRLRNVDLRR
jgi:glycerol-3-phosphate dehydrogenase